MRDVYADPRYLDDPEIESYLSQLGYKLVSVSTRNQREFTFFVVNDPSINAFALPGGNIGVHTGLLLAAQSESELASVIAHEISHVTQDHIARMVASTKPELLAHHGCAGTGHSGIALECQCGECSHRLHPGAIDPEPA